jgi:hypothetical protein
MPYMLAPGARLEIGPGGQLDETLGSLGACCAACESAAPLGATKSPRPSAAILNAVAAQAQRSNVKKMLVVGAIGAAGLGAVLLLRRRRRRR